MNTIHFLPNVPQVLSLKDTSGVIDGFNVLYETSDGRVLSLPRPAAVKLNMLDPEPGEEISITKHQEPRQPAEWVFALTAKSEQGRAEKEVQSDLQRQLIESMARCSYCKEFAGKHKSTCQKVRQMPKAAPSATSEPTEKPKATGTYGPVPQPALASRKTRDSIPYNIAFREIVAFVTKELNDSGEQWSEQSRQDLVSTVLISIGKAGHLGVWER